MLSGLSLNQLLQNAERAKIIYLNQGIPTSVGRISPEVSEDFFLYQNYPNPFNPSATIRCELPEQSLVTLKVYNILGQEVATLVNKEQEAGSYQVQFDATGLACGVFFHRLQASAFVDAKKL
jgi:hypothetical protein